MRKTRVYVSGPMTLGDMDHNIRQALQAADQLMNGGYAPYVPHLTHFQQLIFPRAYEDWMDLDFEWIRQCHILLRLPGESKGADREISLASRLGIPVYWSVEDVLFQEVPTRD